MFASFLILTIVAIFRLCLNELTLKWNIFYSVIPYVNVALYVAIAIFVVFLVIDVIKAILR